MYQPRNLLVTGGAGFIGAHFIYYLKQHSSFEKIVNLDKLTYASNLENLADIAQDENYTFIQADICDRDLIPRILAEHDIDTIVHFAAESHVDRSIENPAPFIETNIFGTFNLLESSKQYWSQKCKLDNTACRFHHISTDEVFGDLPKDAEPCAETTAYKPSSPYSASKASADHLVKAYYRTYGLPISISHCTNNYGPFQHQEKFIPIVISACLKHEKIPIHGDGTDSRDWLYVEDHCAAIDLIIREGRPGENYNIAANNEKKTI